MGAIVLDPIPARGISRRRQTAARVGHLVAAVVAGDGTAAATAQLDLHGVVASTGVADLSLIVAPDLLDVVESAVLDAAGRGPDGLSLTDARATAARAIRRGATISRTAVDPVASTVVEALVRDGRLERDGAIVRPPGMTARDTGPDPATTAAMDRLERALAVPAPPGLAEAARVAGCPPEGIRALEKAGRIVVLERDLAYATTAYDDISATALAMARTAPLTPALLRDATGTSRRYVMAILEDLDRRAVLRRTPDGHIPGSRAP